MELSLGKLKSACESGAQAEANTPPWFPSILLEVNQVSLNVLLVGAQIKEPVA